MIEKRKKPKPKLALGKASGLKKSAQTYEVVGTTSDGVKVLRPKAKPTHFTTQEIRKAINAVRSGQFSPR